MELPEPFDIEKLCEVVASYRGRPIVLQPFASPHGPFGIWASTPTTDYIFYEVETSPLHREHIILHELSHMICGHQSPLGAEAEWVQLLCPDLPVETLRNVLARTTYSTEEDQEAEMLASLVRMRAKTFRRSVTLPGEGASKVRDRLVTYLDASGGSKR